ncbi:MAG: DUF4234 domain-containing protein [Clostridia bacterium]|nr:DUF4234 domain-containing protein [Clostridia bacterium]
MSDYENTGTVNSEVVSAPANEYQPSNAPVRLLKTNRGTLKTILLTIITLGIYPLFLYHNLSEELNITASRYDGRKTMNFLLLFFIVGPITLGIGFLVWFHNFSARAGKELKRRGIDYSFGASSYWLWSVLGIIFIIGPFIYLHKLLKAINLINEDYNQKG